MTPGSFFRLLIVTPLAILITLAMFLLLYLHITPDPFIYRKPDEPNRVYIGDRILCRCGVIWDWLPPKPENPDTTNQYTDPQKVVTEPPTVPEEKVARPEVRIFESSRESPRYCDGKEREGFLHSVAPAYPEACMAKGAEGRVTVEFDIEADGHVADAEIVETADECFNEAVLASVNRRKYPLVCDEGNRPYARRGVLETFIFELTD